MKVIQVGIGGMGNAWLRAVQASPEVDHVSFVEVNDTIAAEQVANYELDGGRIYTLISSAD